MTEEPDRTHQIQKFRDLVRKPQTDDDPERFDERMKMLAKAALAIQMDPA